MIRNIFVVALATILINQVIEGDGARILGLFPAPTHSHYTLGYKLMKELALRGHEVTMISSFVQKTPMNNFTDVVIEGFVEELEVIGKEMFSNMEKPIFQMFFHFVNMAHWITEKVLETKNVQKLLKSNEKFDLVILESFSNEAHVGLAHHFDASLVALSSVGANMLINHYTKNPAPVSYVGQMFTGGNTGKMSYMDRLKNTIVTVFMDVVYATCHYPSQENLLQKYFPGAPSTDEIIRKRLGIVLLNSHPSISLAKPLVPNMIEIGGYHIEEPKELPKELKTYLDSAKEGVILFSMGSNLKSKDLSEEKRNILTSIFKKLPYKVLWKFEDENLPGKPDNVRIGKWLPQNDILAHPNVKLFITHGGLLSTTESVYHGVPVVGIPVYGDQQMNMNNAQSLGIGKAVDYKTLNYDDLWNAVNEVLNNKQYAQNAKERSRVLRDQPIKPIDSAMFWIEYSLRHKYSDHLKTAAIDLKWWELMNLDVLATIGAAIFISLYVSCWVLKKLCCSRKKTSYQQEKKKKQ